MRRLILALLVVVAVSASGHAVSYAAFETITVGASAVGFTAATIQQGGGHQAANFAQCRLDKSSGEINYRLDGTAPTSSVGIQLEPGEYLPTLQQSDVMGLFQAIRTGSSSGTLSCQYFTF